MPSDKGGDPRPGARPVNHTLDPPRPLRSSQRPGSHKTAPMVPGLVLVDAWRYADPMSPSWAFDRRNP
jgi:hypothetical protein